METNKEKLNFSEAKIKLLEIENQQLLSSLEAKNKEIEELKCLIKYLIGNDSSLSTEPNLNCISNQDDNIINLKFGWKINSNARISNDSKTVKKVSGGDKWNCSCFGDKSLIKGKINKWKIQLIKIAEGNLFVFGIIPKGININEIDNWKKGYITCSINFAKHNLGEYKDFANLQAKEGNIIEINADLDRGELSFSINGKNLGVFCNNIIKDVEYVPFVDIYKEESELMLL